MIRAVKPVLFVENEKPERSEELLALIRDLGYVPRWYVTPYINLDDNPNGVRENIYDTTLLTFNLGCLPEGRTELDQFPIADCNHVELIRRMKEEEQQRKAA